MPIDLVQSNSGGFNATGTQTATLGAGTTTGNTLILRVGTYGGSGLATPTGFVRDSNTSAGTQKVYIYRRGPLEGLVAGETSWNITGIAQPVVWDIREYEGMDVAPSNAVSPITTATAATASTGTTAQTSAYDALALGILLARDAASGTGPTWSGHTNSFAEDGDRAQAIAAGTSSIGVCVISKPVTSIGTYECTATHSLSPTTAPVAGTMVVYSSATSTYDAAIAVMDGFEYGTVAGLAIGNVGNKIVEAVAGTPAIVSTSPRSGTYCLELSSSAAAEHIAWGINHFPTGRPIMVVRLCVYFPGSLPGADTDLAMVTSDINAVLRFQASSSKLTMQVGAGTVQAAATTVTTDTWYGVDLRYTMTPATHTCDWQLDGVDQTQATGAGAAAQTALTVVIGWNVAETATVRFDDVAVSVVAGNYPLGDLSILPLMVDPAGTVTISGTTANFQTFTANGTLVAWNATTARGAIDEVPPTIGASADGIAQITAAASDYVEIPMETDQAAPQSAIRSTRVYVCGWSPSATAQSFRVDGWDGTTATTLHAVADPNFDNSTTTPAWVAKMWKPATGWTQAKLDAAAVRVGYSAAAQDVGIHNVMMEVAVQTTEAGALFGEAGGPDTSVERAIDPLSGAIVGLTVDTAPDRGGTLTYDHPGGPTSVYVPAADTDTQVIDDSVDLASVATVSFENDAEPEPPPEPQ